MVAKDIALKKRLIKEGIIGAFVLAALIGAGVLLYSYDSDAQLEKQSKDGENSTIRAEQDSIRQEISTGFEVTSFYKTYIKYHDSGLLLKRDMVTPLVAELREKNHLSNLAITFSAITDMTANFGALKSGVIIKSDVKVTFDAMTDNSVYNFIEDLEHKLPGMIVINDIKITRTGDPSRNMLLDLSQHKLAPLVNGELSFAWVGIRPAEAEKTSTDNSVAAEPASNFPRRGSRHGF